VVITAAHLAKDCGDSLVVVTAGGESVSAKTVRRDDLLDLAILSTEKTLHGVRSLLLSTSTNFLIGSRVSTWGYPSGYVSSMPLLSVGYLAGVDQVKSPPQWIVNGAFNLGNSGGPVISIEDGSVIGVVSSKLAPFPDGLEASLKALHNSRAILMYKRQRSDGTLEDLSEGQIVSEVLDYLRSQTQLVVGYAISVKELRQFLESNGIEP
jgi:S1-C subfamily serine protease